MAAGPAGRVQDVGGQGAGKISLVHLGEVNADNNTSGCEQLCRGVGSI